MTNDCGTRLAPERVRGLQAEMRPAGGAIVESRLRRCPQWLKRSLVVFIAVGALLLVTLVARAHHLPFTDVPTSGLVHDAVGWIWTRGVTLGCTATLYCPNDPVTRASMAVFMNRLGNVLSPKLLVASWGSDSPLDIDVFTVLCQTADYNPPFAQRAWSNVWASLKAAGPMGARVCAVYSSGGSPWIAMGPTFARAGASTLDEWAHANDSAVIDMIPGTAYRFGIGVDRSVAGPGRGGTADADAFRCRAVVQITNRNPDGIAPDSAAPPSVTSTGVRDRR